MNVILLYVVLVDAWIVYLLLPVQPVCWQVSVPILMDSLA